jgi:hypothetical protein
MESDHSLVIEEVRAPDTREVPRSEGTITRSSSRDASDHRSDDGTNMQGGSKPMEPRESSRSYVFGPSIIMVGCIRQLASLGYFAEGAA